MRAHPAVAGILIVLGTASVYGHSLDEAEVRWQRFLDGG